MLRWVSFRNQSKSFSGSNEPSNRHWTWLLRALRYGKIFQLWLQNGLGWIPLQCSQKSTMACPESMHRVDPWELAQRFSVFLAQRRYSVPGVGPNASWHLDRNSKLKKRGLISKFLLLKLVIDGASQTNEKSQWNSNNFDILVQYTVVLMGFLVSWSILNAALTTKRKPFWSLFQRLQVTMALPPGKIFLLPEITTRKSTQGPAALFYCLMVPGRRSSNKVNLVAKTRTFTACWGFPKSVGSFFRRKPPTHLSV